MPTSFGVRRWRRPTPEVVSEAGLVTAAADLLGPGVVTELKVTLRRR